MKIGRWGRCFASEAKVGALVCPACDAAQYKTLAHIEFGPNRDWAENTLQRARCGECQRMLFGFYCEGRSMRPDRDDPVSHVCYGAGTIWQWLSALAFERPRRRVSAPWRRKVGAVVASRLSDDTWLGPVGYKPTPQDSPRLANEDRP